MISSFRSRDSRRPAERDPRRDAAAATGDLAFGDDVAPAPPRPHASRRGAERPVAGRRAVVVEDEIVIAMHLQGLLEELGVEVCDIAATGAEALDFIDRFEPELVLMDVNLRGTMDGVDVARRILEQRTVRIIFVTAYGDAKTLERIETAAPGALVLRKPAVAGALEQAIAKAFAS